MSAIQSVTSSALFKAFVVGALALFLLIPSSMVLVIVNERENTQRQVINEISSKWGYAQTFTGPIISIPYNVYSKDNAGNLVKYTEYAHFLPNTLKVDGKILPEKRYRGIFEVVVYKSDLKVEGNFDEIDLSKTGIETKEFRLNEAIVSVGINDLRGIEEQIRLQWNGQEYLFNGGLENSDVLTSGMHTRLNLSPDSLNKKTQFSFTIKMNGSEYLYFTPVGKETEVRLASDWAAPSFNGAFLPDKKNPETGGFPSEWKVLNLNRNYPQFWRGNKYQISDSAFGVDLLIPVTGYTQTNRAVKYAIMFIGLTFMVFFFVEILNKKPVHPIQYILIGLALSLFYLLLLSLSEHIGFNAAYLVGGSAVVLMITLYVNSILQTRAITGITFGILTFLYGFLFVILQMEDYSLLFGTLLLFAVLATVMYMSRRVNWYSVGKQEVE